MKFLHTLSLNSKIERGLDSKQFRKSEKRKRNNTFKDSGVQRKLDMNNQDVIKNDKNFNSVNRRQKYRPRALDGPTTYLGKTRGVCDTTEKFTNMTLGFGRPLAKPSVPPPMKAGGLHGQSA